MWIISKSVFSLRFWQPRLSLTSAEKVGESRRALEHHIAILTIRKVRVAQIRPTVQRTLSPIPTVHSPRYDDVIVEDVQLHVLQADNLIGALAEQALQCATQGRRVVEEDLCEDIDNLLESLLNKVYLL